MAEPLTPELEAEIRKLSQEADEWAGPPVVSLNARRLGSLLTEIDRLRAENADLMRSFKMALLHVEELKAVTAQADGKEVRGD